VNASQTALAALLTTTLAEARRLNRLPGELDTPAGANAGAHLAARGERPRAGDRAAAMTDRARYGDLMDPAARHIADASTLLGTRPLPTPRRPSRRSRPTGGCWQPSIGTAGSCPAATAASWGPVHPAPGTARMPPPWQCSTSSGDRRSSSPDRRRCRGRRAGRRVAERGDLRGRRHRSVGHSARQRRCRPQSHRLAARRTHGCALLASARLPTSPRR
jgi:hypothetical protein